MEGKKVVDLKGLKEDWDRTEYIDKQHFPRLGRVTIFRSGQSRESPWLGPRRVAL